MIDTHTTSTPKRHRALRLAAAALLSLTALAAAPAQAEPVSAAQAESYYPDVPADHWARQALEDLAQKHGLVLGYPDGTFQGNRALTRFEMAALLRRLLEKTAGSEAGPDQAAFDKLKAELKAELEELATRNEEELQTIYDRIDLVETESLERHQDLLERLGLQVPFRLSGDLAIRYEHASTNLSDLAATTSSTPQSRLVINLDSIGDGPFAYGARLSIGNPRNPVNPWWRLGDFFARVEASFDRFFVSWRPTDFLDITAGKFRNLYSNSELLLDFDIQPEGAFQQLHFADIAPFWPKASLTLGETIVNMNPLYKGNIFMLSAKGDSRFSFGEALNLDLSLAYHHWLQEGLLRGANQLASDNNQAVRIVGNRDNNSPGAEFGILDGFAKLTWNLTPDLPLSLSADYLRNLRAPTRNQALQAGLSLGALRRPGDWQFAYFFKYLEADASASYFVEDQLGGTDVMAHEGQAQVRVWDKTTLFASYQYANSLTLTDQIKHTIRLGVNQSF